MLAKHTLKKSRRRRRSISQDFEAVAFIFAGTLLLGLSAIYCPAAQSCLGHELANVQGEFLFSFIHAEGCRTISFFDQGPETGTALKVELIDAPGPWGERRYRIRVNGREPVHVKRRR